MDLSVSGHLASFSVQDVVHVTVVPWSHDLQAALIDVLGFVGTVELTGKLAWCE